MRRKLWVILVALLLAVGICDALVWHLAVQGLRCGFANWAAAQRGDGWSVATVPPQAGGWPLAATLTLRDVRLRGGADDVPGGLSWGAQRVVLRLGLRHPYVLQVEAMGNQHLRLSDAPDIAYSARRLLLSVLLRPESQPRLLGIGLRAHLASDPVAADAVTVNWLDAEFAPHPAASPGSQPAQSVSLQATGIDLPRRERWALGREIAALKLDATLDGPLPDKPMLAANARAWRDSGGRLTIQRLQTLWGPLDLTAHGTLWLDATLQPAGNATTEITGYGPTLTALAHAGVMSRSAAIAAAAVLSLLADTPGGGGHSQVTVPLSLRHRILSVRQWPLLRLPVLDWPQQQAYKSHHESPDVHDAN